jgi:hypothetical protein
MEEMDTRLRVEEDSCIRFVGDVCQEYGIAVGSCEVNYLVFLYVGEVDTLDSAS